MTKRNRILLAALVVGGLGGLAAYGLRSPMSHGRVSPVATQRRALPRETLASKAPPVLAEVARSEAGIRPPAVTRIIRPPDGERAADQRYLEERAEPPPFVPERASTNLSVWATEYRDEVCRCASRTCVAELQGKYVRALERAAQRGDGSDSDDAALGEAVRCYQALPAGS